MQLRLTSLDEYQFLTTIKNEVWGSKSARFKDWQVGDILVFIVDKSIAGFAEVKGVPYTSKQRVWDNGVFPHRIPIRFVHVLFQENRIPILGNIRDALISSWGSKYGIGILNQRPLSGEPAEIILNAIRARRNDLPDIIRLLDRYLEEAKFKRDTLAASRTEQTVRTRLPLPSSDKKPQTPGARVKQSRSQAEEPQSKEEQTLHSRIQAVLVRLGKVTGCAVWVAVNDRNRKYRGHPLGDGALKALPNLGLNRQAMNRIGLIDVIWVRQNSPLCAFEIEATTSVYSGLLRMSDLLSVVPALNIQLYIVASRDRQERVMSELRRPTFQKIGLSDYCRFIPTDSLESLLQKVESLQGHVQPSILETIALEVESELDSSLE